MSNHTTPPATPPEQAAAVRLSPSVDFSLAEVPTSSRVATFAWLATFASVTTRIVGVPFAVEATRVTS